MIVTRSVSRRPASPRRRAGRRSSRCRPTTPAEERPCARTIVSRLGGEAYRRPLDARRSRRAACRSTTPARPRAASKAASALRSKRFWRARTSSSGSSASRRPCSPATIYRRQRLRPGVAAVVLPVGRAARPGTAGAGEPRRADGSRRRSRSRRAGCWPIRAPRRSARASPAQWLRLQDIDKVHPDPNFYPELRRAARRHDAARDRAVLRQPGSRGPQRPRSLPRRLHVRERAARAPLRHSRASPAPSSAA